MVPERDPEQREYSIDDARQGQIVLRHRWSRIIFIGGLVAILLLPLIIALVRG